MFYLVFQLFVNKNEILLDTSVWWIVFWRMHLCWICRYSQLQSDLKTTNMQEMKITAETYFEEYYFFKAKCIYKIYIKIMHI